MPSTRLLKTSTFRLAFFAAMLFTASGILVLAFIYFDMLRMIDRQIAGALARESADLSMEYTREGSNGLAEAVAYRMSERQGSVRLYLVVDAAGHILAGNLATWPADAPAAGAPAIDVALPEEGHGAARIEVVAFADGTRVLVGRDLTERLGIQHVLEGSLAAAAALMLALGVAAGLAMSRHALRRLDAVNRTAAAILAGNLDDRVRLSGSRDEFDQLGAAINAMLDRIQHLIATIRNVTHNVAHDLRTPLNRLRGRLEIAVRTPRETEEYRAVIQQGIREADDIIGTFNAMLRIAEIRGRGRTRPNEPVDLSETVESLADLYQPLAEENGLEMLWQAAPGITVSGDAPLISQALNNLIDNAVKYTPPGGTVVVAARTRGDTVELEVRDSGAGIPPDKRTEVLQHFSRLDSSRHTPGSGLGLSLVAAVADYHGATLTLADNHPGLKVTLTFASG
jgi:signal transduction histidine kinase